MHSHTLPPLHAACLQGLVTAHARGPRQRSSPTREASLGLGLTSALSGDRSVGLPSPGTSAGVEGAGLVPVASGDAREPHRRPVRWGSPGRLPRFWGIESAPGDMAARTTWIVASNNRGPLTEVRTSLTPWTTDRSPPIAESGLWCPSNLY